MHMNTLQIGRACSARIETQQTLQNATSYSRIVRCGVTHNQTNTYLVRHQKRRDPERSVVNAVRPFLQPLLTTYLACACTQLAGPVVFGYVKSLPRAHMVKHPPLTTKNAKRRQQSLLGLFESRFATPSACTILPFGPQWLIPLAPFQTRAGASDIGHSHLRKHCFPLDPCVVPVTCAEGLAISVPSVRSCGSRFSSVRDVPFCLTLAEVLLDAQRSIVISACRLHKSTTRNTRYLQAATNISRT